MIAFLIDADNLSAPPWIDEAFQILEQSEGSIAIRRAYGSSENLKGLTDTLRTWAIRPFQNSPLSKNTTDLSLAVDAMELACLTPRPKLIVIGSGDLDFVPLVVRLRERGIRVVCVSAKNKMAAEAATAYDKVIYVMDDHGASSLTKEKLAQVSPAKKIAPTPAKKTVAAKTPSPKPAPAKKVATKNGAKKTPAVTPAVTVKSILAAVPDLQAGEWMALGNAAKMLHEENLLGRNGSSTKLFGKFPDHFELKPAKQPNSVRLILTQA